MGKWVVVTLMGDWMDSRGRLLICVWLASALMVVIVGMKRV